MRDGDTICAPATPRGDGAVGMLRLSGPEALALCLQASGKRARDLPPRRMVAARLRDPGCGATVDRVLLCHMAAPASYTGEPVVEVFGHGGQLNMERLLDLFLRLGARLARPGEFTRRAFLNGKLSLEQAEAVAMVIGARSERALQNAQALLDGALGQQVRALHQDLVQLAARLEAAVDFADDLDGELPAGRLGRRCDDARQRLERLQGTERHAAALGELVVALVGPANAGKSSLFNQLLGRDRALVDPEPGTTRDYLEAEVSWGGLRVTLVDTAGLRAPDLEAALERRGRQLATPLLGRSQLLVAVLDLQRQEPDTPPPAGLPEAVPVLQAANKLDLCPPSRRRALKRCPSVVATSALTGEGVPQLREAIVAQLSQQLPDGEALVVTARRHRLALAAAREELARARGALSRQLPPEIVVEHVNAAMAQLDGITGRHLADEAVLDAIFSEFCLGK